MSYQIGRMPEHMHHKSVGCTPSCIVSMRVSLGSNAASRRKRLAPSVQCIVRGLCAVHLVSEGL